MDNKSTQSNVQVDSDSSESQVSQTESITSMDRLMEIYDQVATGDDIAQRTAAILTTTNYYNYALKLSNDLNGRQGKTRSVVTDRTTKLMGYSLDTDVDEITDKTLTELYLNMINTYLADKQDLPSDRPRTAQGVVSRVKALFIMLITTNQYWIIPLIDPIPRYMLKMTTNLFDKIREIKDDALMSFIHYLKESGNVEMANIVSAAGNEFWGTEGVKPNVIYDRYFGSMLDRIKKPEETYNQYLEFRSQYRASTRSIMPSKIYDIFSITADSYNHARVNVYEEMKQLFPESEYANQIKKLIYEQ